MAPANDAVFLRRNNQIQDAIDGQNLKQALQLIEKRIKKGEDTRFLKAWKAHVLFRHADEAHHNRGIKETLELCNAEPPTTDLDTLNILFQTLQKMDGHHDVRSNLWDRAAKAKPQDQEIQLKWFNTAFEGNDWKSAQKAAMSLQKNFPKERKFYFWAIFLSYLLGSDKGSSDMDRKLFGTLAYRMMSKAAADVPADPSELLSLPRAIQTSEEVYLFVKILESQQRFEEAVNILDSKNMGITSQIIKNDHIFVTEKAANLGMGKQWEAAAAFVKDVYKIPEDESKKKALLELDDWKIWNLLVEANRHLTTAGSTASSLEVAENFVSFNPKSRNAALARLHIIACGVTKGDKTTDDLLVACRQFVDGHKHKLYAFTDIRRILDGDRDAMSKILDYISSDQKHLVTALNTLKLDYCLNISGSDGIPPKQKIDDFVTRCLKLYETTCAPSGNKQGQGQGDNSSAMESKPSDDLCVLAAMALLQTDGSNESQSQVPDTALIRAAGILGRLLDDSPHNYQALLLLVRIQILLGAGSLALSSFSKLSVKQMQYETVAYNLFTRLATIHPHTAPPPADAAELKDFDPQSALVQALAFFRTADVNTHRYRGRGLEEGTYVNVDELIELRKRLMNSVSRRMYALDVRRAQRLVGGDPMTRYDDLVRENSPSVDSRGYNAFMDCEFVGKTPFEVRLRQGPAPKDNWLASARITDQLFGVLKGIAIQRPLTPETDLPDLGALSLSEENEQTAVEKETTTVHKELLKVATYMAGSKLTSAEQADKALGQVEDWLVLKKKDLTLDEKNVSPLIASSSVFIQSGRPTAPTWRYLHAVFTLLETLKALSQLVGLASRKAPKPAKLPKERVERLLALVPEVFEMVRSNTRALKQRLSESGVLTSLIDLVTQGEQSAPYGKELQSALESSLNMPTVEVFCGSLMESWEEALDGVMRVKL